MADLARAAGMGTSSLYQYFGGKEALLDALAERLGDDLEEMFEVHVPASCTFMQKLEILLVHQARWTEARGSLVTFLSGRDIPSRPGQPNGRDAYRERLIAWLLRHAPEGVSRHPPDFTADFIIGAGRSSYLAGATDPHRLARLLDALEHGLFDP